MREIQTHIVRRPKSAISIFSINIVHIRNPLAVAWWSLAYPGFGHLRLLSTLKGIFLFLGELIINTQAHLNMAIIYSFTGNFAMAKQVIDTRLLLLYCGILIFAAWDSYRIALEINKLSILADHENATITPVALTSMGINGNDKRNPWVAAAWGALMPGAGHFYCVAIINAMLLMISGTVIVYFANLLPAIQYTFWGEFAQAQAVVNWQWLLNLPSIYCFSIYDAYVRTVEFNKLFDQEQAQFLRNNYQSPNFVMPLQPVPGGN